MPFERTYQMGANGVLDVSTARGRIEIVGAETDRVTVTGTATVRIGWNVPANAVEIAKRVAANPPVEEDGGDEAAARTRRAGGRARWLQ